jgi:hypothetical protein
MACGNAFERRWNLSNSPSSLSVLPSLALDDTMGPLVLWQERAQGGNQILFRQGAPPPDGGVPVVDGEVGSVGQPDVAYDPATRYAHAVWTESIQGGGSDVFYARWRVSVPTPTPTRTASPTVTASPTPGTGTPSATPVPPRRIYVPAAWTSR